MQFLSSEVSQQIWLGRHQSDNICRIYPEKWEGGIEIPTKLEAELRAVQTSIAEVKRQMKDTDSKTKSEYLKNVLKQYYQEEERLLFEINRKEDL